MMEWMFWTRETTIVFGILGSALLILAILDYYRRSTPRKGFLPMRTTRGDRFFFGMIFIIVIGFLWLVFVPFSTKFCSIPALVVFFIIQIWG